MKGKLIRLWQCQYVCLLHFLKTVASPPAVTAEHDEVTRGRERPSGGGRAGESLPTVNPPFFTSTSSSVIFLHLHSLILAHRCFIVVPLPPQNKVSSFGTAPTADFQGSKRGRAFQSTKRLWLTAHKQSPLAVFQKLPLTTGLTWLIIQPSSSRPEHWLDPSISYTSPVTATQRVWSSTQWTPSSEVILGWRVSSAFPRPEKEFH